MNNDRKQEIKDAYYSAQCAGSNQCASDAMETTGCTLNEFNEAVRT